MTLQQRGEEFTKGSDLVEPTQDPVGNLQIRAVIKKQDDRTRRVTRKRLNEVFEEHSNRGLLRSGVTLAVYISVFEEETDSLIANLVREVSALHRSAGAFSRIREAVEEYHSLLDGELKRITERVEQEIPDRARCRELSKGAEKIWLEKRSGLLDELEKQRSKFLALPDEASDSEIPAQTCVACSHWELMSRESDCYTGFCRRFALGPNNDGWPITETNDTCEDWTGGGFFKGKDGAVHVDRRAAVRSRVDCPVQLRMPSGDRMGRLIDISERGARLQLENPPREGASAMLQWGSQEVFCEVAWANEGACGVFFERPLLPEILIETTGAGDESAVPVADPKQIPIGKKRISCKFQIPPEGSSTK